MPWKYNGVTLKVGREFTGTDGTQYPKVWMRYSDSEKAAIGITWEDPPASEAPFDNRFYSSWWCHPHGIHNSLSASIVLLNRSWNCITLSR